MYVCIHACVYVYVYAYTHIYTCIHTCVYVYVFVYVYTHVYVCLLLSACVHFQTQHSSACPRCDTNKKGEESFLEQMICGNAT